MIPMVKITKAPPAEREDGPLDFASFYTEQRTALLRGLILVTGNSAEADDLTQEAFARILERWDRVRSMESPAGYLFRTALNLHRSRLRSLLRRKAVPMSDTPRDAIAETDDRAMVHRALQRCTPEQRSALVLVHLVGMSSEEAGAILGIDGDAVRARLARGRQTLRDALGGLDD